MLAASLASAMVARAETVIYSTGFERPGYDPAYTLVGQANWDGVGTGGNGVVTNWFPGQGQQAYLGYWPPLTNGDFTAVWQPINLNPVPRPTPLVVFSVDMEIDDSSTTNRDDFHWSVYNTNGDRLFTLDFDNYSTGIYYELDGTNDYVYSNWVFDRNTTYSLAITMDFGRNRWTATLGGTVIVSEQPMTTLGLPLNLGRVQASWLIYDPLKPGDNLMVFDNYQVVAWPVSAPDLAWLGQRSGDGAPLLQLNGWPDYQFAIEASTNLQSWTPLKTNVAAGGSFEFIDAGAVGLPRRFYRGRWVP